MNCKEFEMQIVLFSELTNDEQTRVIAHMNTCKSCLALFESVTHTNNLVLKASKVEMEINNPFRLTNDIMARIRTEKRQPWNLFDPFLKFEFGFLKYAMATMSFLLVFFFGVEQFQSPVIAGDVVPTSRLKKVVLNRKTFQDELSKSKAVESLFLANSCKSPFNITKVNEDCVKQRMAIYKEL